MSRFPILKYGIRLFLTKTVAPVFGFLLFLAFNSLMDKWSGLKINFIGFIHDAIIIDVHPESFSEVNKLNFVYEEKMDIKLPVKAERIS